MKKISTMFLVLCIVILAFFLRVWRVWEVPPSLSWDEASIGYNAYSILKTGKDEHGRFLPYDTFEAFGDYKPPISVYATVPFIAIFGLNELTVRLPSVLAGTLAVLLTYFVTKKLLSRDRLGVPISILTSFLLAITPWHLQLSRAGFEANIAFLFLLLGAYLILSGREKQKLFIIGAIPFVAAMYTFNSARFSAPLIALGLVVYCLRQVRAHMRNFSIGIIIGIFTLLPLIPHLISPQSRLRFAEVNIFSDSSIVVASNKRMEVDGNTFWSKVFHNRRISFAREYLIHFFDNLDPRFLFVRGDGNPKFSIQDIGELYLIELPFMILGIGWLFQKHRSVAWLAVFWITAAIIPAATARETPHALRIENSLPMWQLFIAGGLVSSIAYFGDKRKKIILAMATVAYIISFSYFWHNYFNHYATEFSGEWQYGYREAIEYVRSIKYQYKNVVIDDYIGRPYIYALFYDQSDPAKFQNSVNRSVDGAGFFHVNGFDQYQFVNSRPTYQKNILYILRPTFVPNYANILSTVTLLNGSPVLVIFDITEFPKKT